MNKILFFIVMAGLLGAVGIGALSTDFDLIAQAFSVFHFDQVVECNCVDQITGLPTLCEPPISPLCPPP